MAKIVADIIAQLLIGVVVDRLNHLLDLWPVIWPVILQWLGLR